MVDSVCQTAHEESFSRARSGHTLKAKASLKLIYQSALEARLRSLKSKQEEEAIKLVTTLQPVALQDNAPSKKIRHSTTLDPKAVLQLRVEDKSLDVFDEDAFLRTVVCDHYPQQQASGNC